MGKIVLVGTTPLTKLWNNATITPPNNNSPPFSQGQGSTKDYRPDDYSISWIPPSGFTIPGFLNGITLNNLKKILSTVDSTNYEVILNINILPGAYQRGTFQNLNINIYTTLGATFSTNIPALGPAGAIDTYYCNGNVCPSTSENMANYEINQIQATPWNDCGFFCNNESIFDLNLTAQTSITLTVDCSDIFNLDSGFCLNFCTDTPQNLTFCKLTYQDYCFSTPEGATGPAIIFTGSTGCQTFFSDYNSQLGPEAAVDGLISNYCSSKFGNVGFEGLFFANPPNSDIDKNLCACHMPDSFYQAYQESIVNLEPAFANYITNSGIDSRCLVSFCAGSPYPTSKIGKQCQIPQCIQVAEFKNNGSITGPVKISQDSTCQKIASGQDTGGGGGGGGGTVNETKSWIEKHWVWVVLGVGIFLALIIVILIILFSGGNKKSGTTVKKKP